jgi:hypothetical protein
LTREQVLEELRFLTTVEHAVIVEDLSLHCALGHDLPADDGGATTQQGSAARDQGFALAQGAMFRYKALQLALVEAGGDPELGRATSVSSDSVPGIPMAPTDAVVGDAAWPEIIDRATHDRLVGLLDDPSRSADVVAAGGVTGAGSQSRREHVCCLRWAAGPPCHIAVGTNQNDAA